jgi:chromosome segregation ATPase
LGDKQKEVDLLTTEINKVNNDLLILKDQFKRPKGFEIARLKTESKIYKQQRDSRPNISFLNYQQLLVDRDNALSKLTSAKEQLKQQIDENQQQKIKLEQAQTSYTQYQQNCH